MGLLNYRLCDSSAKEQLEQKGQRIAALSTQPLYILREMLQYLTHERLVAPQYTTLQDMIGRVVSNERNRVMLLLAENVSATVSNQLDALLLAQSGIGFFSPLNQPVIHLHYPLPERRWAPDLASPSSAPSNTTIDRPLS